MKPIIACCCCGWALLSTVAAIAADTSGSSALKRLSESQLARKDVRIATVQIDSPWVWQHPIDPDRDPADRVIPYIERAAKDGCDLICFPELFLGMFRVPSPQTDKVAKAARDNKINVTIGCFEVVDPSGNYRNSTLVFDRRGAIVGRYFKAYQAVGTPPYLWPPRADDPEWMMQPGQEFPVFDLDFGRIGILTCYDGYFPEIWRLLSLKGAEIVLWPNARGGEVEDYLVRSAIASNYVHVVTSNKSYGSGTMIAAWPSGIQAICDEAKEQYVAATMSLESLREARINSREFHQRRAKIHQELANDFPVWEYYGRENPVGLEVPEPNDRLRHQILDRLEIDFNDPVEGTTQPETTQPEVLDGNHARDEPRSGSPELWLGHYNPEYLGDPEKDWVRASEEIDGIEFYINMIAYKVPPDQLTTFCRSLRRRGIAIGVSAAYFDWDPVPDTFLHPSPETPIQDRVRMEMKPGVGVETARTEMKKLESLLVASGGIDLIAMDGPIRRLLYPGADTGRTTPKGDAQGMDDVGDAVEEIIRYMRTWQDSHPNVRFVVLSNFPNWGWNGAIAYWGSGPNGMYWGDYRPAIDLLIKRCREADVPLDAIRVDHPYEFATGEFRLDGTKWPTPIKDPRSVDWMQRILELEDLVRSSGLKFELIVNSEYGGASSNEAFTQRSLQYLDLYHVRGGRPDRYVLEGWYHFPDQLGPDTMPYTLSNTAIKFADRIRKRETEPADAE